MQPVVTVERRVPISSEARDVVHHYSAFGGVLRSALEFPELSPSTTSENPDWTLTIDQFPPREDVLAFVGERHVRAEWYRLWRGERGFRLEYSHAGVFDILGDGRSIIWYRRSESPLELVRSIVLGPAIALAFELSGLLCLHGSAVRLEHGAVAFLGPKHFGKSTLATALTTAGGRLIGDDLLVVDPGPPTSVRPGIASVRLWRDVTAALPLKSVCRRLIPGIKTTAEFAADSIALTPTPVRAIYLLAPVPAETNTPAVRRTRLAPLDATIALAHQTKLPDSLVGLPAAGSRLAAAATVAATASVWRLHLARDLDRIPDVVRQIIAWSHVA